MVQIHGLVWLSIGAIVTAVSGYMGGKVRFFFWVGLVMVAFGVFKLIVHYITDEAPAKLIPTQENVARCPNCQEPVYTTAKFCHMCSAKLPF